MRYGYKTPSLARHHGGQNVVFLDQHAAWIRANQMDPYGFKLLY